MILGVRFKPTKRQEKPQLVMKLYWKRLLYFCTAFYVQCKTVSKNNNLPLNKKSWSQLKRIQFSTQFPSYQYLKLDP